MARKSTKTASNPTEQITEAIDTPVNLEWDATAAYLNIPVPELQERVAAKLDDPTVFAWDNLPVEHEALVEVIRRDLEAEASVRRLEPQAEVQLPQVEEPPLMEEEPEAPKAKQSKRHKSSSLTKAKAKEIANTKEDTKQTNQGINETLRILQAKEAVVDSSQDATAYLATYATNLTNLKGEGLNYFAAQSMQKISQASGFSPEEIMRQVGVPLAAETKAKLNETMAQVLGKSQAAMEEILETTWGNGYNLEAELSHLTNLMNSDD